MYRMDRLGTILGLWKGHGPWRARFSAPEKRKKNPWLIEVPRCNNGVSPKKHVLHGGLSLVKTQTAGGFRRSIRGVVHLITSLGIDIDGIRSDIRRAVRVYALNGVKIRNVQVDRRAELSISRVWM